MTKTICPICSQELNTPLRPDFLLCPDCQIAVRVSGTLAKEPDRLGVYSSDWVKAHSQNPIAKDIAKSTAGITRSVIGSKQADVLDIGCGSGLLVDHLAQHGYNAIGLDWSEAAIEHAKRHYRGVYILSNVEQGLSIGRTLDCAVASHILEHLENPHEFLQSVKKILEPDGYLVVAVPNLDWWNPKSIYRSVSTIFDPEHVVGYSAKGMRKVLKANGYEVVKMVSRTHRLAILTAVGITLYQRLCCTKISWNGNITTRNDVSETHIGTAQKTYTGITDNPIVSTILSALLSLLNKLTERNLRGMELIAIAKKVTE
jgi:2-polyprenyl-3-methyl-5-hydroxy-6-metoxy-1,4-benzoquinol methylase